MQDDVVLAHKTLRRWSIVAAVLLGAAGLTLIGLLHSQLRQLEDKDLPEQNRKAVAQRVVRLTRIVAALGSLGFITVGFRLWGLGRRVNQSGRFPPPGMKVVRDTPVRTGPKARTVANVAQLTAFLCAIVGTIGMWYLYRLAATILGD
jgi:hypothetical protein